MKSKPNTVFVQITPQYPHPYTFIHPQENYFDLPLLAAKELGMKTYSLSFLQKCLPVEEKTKLCKIIRVKNYIELRKTLKQLKPNLIYTQGFEPYVYMASKIAKTINQPHAYFIPQNFLHRLHLPKFIRSLVVRKVYSNLACLRTNTLSEAERFEKIGISCKKRSFPTPIADEYFNIKRKPHKKFIGITIASIGPRKNVETIMKAAKILEKEIDYEHWFIGGFSSFISSDINYKKKIMSMSKDYNNVKFFGQKSPKELMTLLSYADLHISSSWDEAQLLAAGEASAAGLPSALSNIEPLFELYNKHALYHKYWDEKTLAKNILRLAKDKELYKKFSKIARKEAEQFRYSTLKNQTKKLFLDILNDKQHR